MASVPKHDTHDFTVACAMKNYKALTSTVDSMQEILPTVYIAKSKHSHV